MEVAYKTYNDEQLCAMILSGGEARNKALRDIYSREELKHKIRAHIITKGADRAEANDILHDGMIALDRNIRMGKFRGESGLEGYLFSICRFLWHNAFRKKMKYANEEPEEYQFEPDAETPEIHMLEKEKKELLARTLQLIDDRCRNILTLWKRSYSMEEIASETGLSSAEMAKKYRYRCMKKLTAALENQPQLLQALNYV